MWKKLLAALGMTVALNTSGTAAELHKPYAESQVNFLYNLLFCDDISLFQKHGAGGADDLWTALLAERPDTDVTCLAFFGPSDS